MLSLSWFTNLVIMERSCFSSESILKELQYPYCCILYQQAIKNFFLLILFHFLSSGDMYPSPFLRVKGAKWRGFSFR
jgi:hypothetical protein